MKFGSAYSTAAERSSLATAACTPPVTATTSAPTPATPESTVDDPGRAAQVRLLLALASLAYLTISWPGTYSPSAAAAGAPTAAAIEATPSAASMVRFTS